MHKFVPNRVVWCTFLLLYITIQSSHTDRGHHAGAVAISSHSYHIWSNLRSVFVPTVTLTRRLQEPGIKPATFSLVDGRCATWSTAAAADAGCLHAAWLTLGYFRDYFQHFSTTSLLQPQLCWQSQSIHFPQLSMCPQTYWPQRRLFAFATGQVNTSRKSHLRCYKCLCSVTSQQHRLNWFIYSKLYVCYFIKHERIFLVNRSKGVTQTSDPNEVVLNSRSEDVTEFSWKIVEKLR